MQLTRTFRSSLSSLHCIKVIQAFHIYNHRLWINRKAHVRVREGVEMRLPGATRFIYPIWCQKSPAESHRVVPVEAYRLQLKAQSKDLAELKQTWNRKVPLWIKKGIPVKLAPMVCQRECGWGGGLEDVKAAGKASGRRKTGLNHALERQWRVVCPVGRLLRPRCDRHLTE
jgi:hypothetical protein